MNIEQKNTDSGAQDERSGGIQVIARAAAILNTLGDLHDGLSLAEIAKQVDLPRSTVQRIVQALAQEGLVQADRSDGVKLGPALLRLVARVHTDVVAVVTPYLQQLCGEVEETVAVGRVSGSQLAFIHAAVAERQLRVVPQVGASLPLYSTSGGRALLSLSSDSDAMALVGTTFERITPHTVRSASALAAILQQARTLGYATESNETELGISSVAIALDTVLGRYSISVVIPSDRFAARRDMVIERLLVMKRTLHNEIGKHSGM